MTQSASSSTGFTMFELILVSVLILVFVAFTTPYLLGFGEKSTLTNERDKIIGNIKLAQQKSIGAEGDYVDGVESGFSHGVELSTNSVELLYIDDAGAPNPIKVTPLSPKVSITDADPPKTITFEKITGIPTGTLSFILSSKRFKALTEITIDGVIETHAIEKN